MPELAEVEWYRKQWNPGIGTPIFEVRLHPLKRVFRGTDTRALRTKLTGAKLLRSTTRGKRMLFKFSGDNWLGIHLGMTGKIRMEPANFPPGNHEPPGQCQGDRAT